MAILYKDIVLKLFGCKKKANLENLVFNATAKYVLKPEIIDRLAKEIALRFNEGLQKPTEFMLLEKQQKNELNDMKNFHLHRKAPLNIFCSNWVLVSGLKLFFIRDILLSRV